MNGFLIRFMVLVVGMFGTAVTYGHLEQRHPYAAAQAAFITVALLLFLIFLAVLERND